MARILIVDDEAPIRSLLRHILERSGHHVMEACDGSEGLRLQTETPADLVITDLIMPGKEGIETIVEMKKGSPGTKIIAISGGGRINPEEYLEIARGIGANHVFVKPVDRSELLGAIEQLLDKR